MPRKPDHPTMYPQMTRADALSTLASLFAAAAVRCASQATEDIVEPEIHEKHVDKDTSVKQMINEVQLIPRRTQPSLFDEDES